MENKKELKFILTMEDFKKNSKVSIDTMNNVFDSFRNYLKLLDTQELKNLDENGNYWTIDKLKKLELKNINLCRDLIKGNMSLVSDKGKMSLINSTELIVKELITPINLIILIRKKIKEFETSDDLKFKKYLSDEIEKNIKENEN